MALESEDWQKINDCLIRLYKELDSQRHPRLMLELINELVPMDSGAVNFYKPPDQLTAVLFPEGYATDEQIALVGRYSYQSPYGYYIATQDASWRRATDFMPAEDFHKLDLYHLALKPLQCSYQLGGMLMFMNDTAYIVTLHRAYEDFTDHERDILNTLHPHLVTSYINAIVYSKAHNSVTQIKAVMETAPGAYGCFDAHGKVAWLQEKAKAWLDEFFAGQIFHENRIPQSIQQLLVDFQSGDPAPKQITQLKHDEMLVVCLGASPISGWIMRLERKPRTPLPRFRPLPPLSKRQNDVLQWMTEGKRNAEIACILGISPRTVERHVAEILATLNVENRATAILAAMEFSAKVNMGS